MNSLLVVDDEPSIRSLISRWAGGKYAIAEAGCAGEALDEMAAHPAAIALCDISMPDRDGLWLAAQLRRQFAETAIVLVTGHGDEYRASSSDAGVVGYLVKPFTREQLLDALERAMEWHDEQAAAGAWGRPGRTTPARTPVVS
jgi:CheY-like chemotaxis protein